MFSRIKNLFWPVPATTDKLPRTLVVEPTNYCNLNCPFCMVGIHAEFIEKHGDASHNHLTRPMGYMSDDTFERIIQEARAFGIKKVQLHFQGEPLLHKQFVEMVKRLKGEGFEVQFFTNGILLTEDTARRIIGTGIDMVRFSVDGATSETYVKNRVGGDFNKVFTNLETIAKLARGTKTRIEWQFIVLSNNEHEVGKAKELAQRIGVYLVLKSYAKTEEGLSPENKDYVRELKKKPCTDIYSQIGIYWNGDVVACCYDTDGRNVLGNINQNSLEDIWNSSAYKTFRENIDTVGAKGEEPGICKTCLRWGI